MMKGRGLTALAFFSCPYSPKCLEDEFCELRLYGVLRSSLRASNPKLHQRYDIWGMCHASQSCYAASQ
jgi:hypothetical protein